MGSSVPTHTDLPADLLRPHRVYEKGWLRIDFDAYEVWVDGERANLFLREFEILRLFVQAPNRVFTRQQLLDLVWGERKSVDPRTVDVHIRRLRKHLGDDSDRGEVIVTVRGVGYKFNDRALSGTESPPPPERLPV